MANTMIRDCDCKHAQQDQMYGKGQRVHNLAAKGRDFKGWRCTVCGKLKTPSPSEKLPIPETKESDKDSGKGTKK